MEEFLHEIFGMLSAYNLQRIFLYCIVLLPLAAREMGTVFKLGNYCQHRDGRLTAPTTSSMGVGKPGETGYPLCAFDLQRLLTEL